MSNERGYGRTLKGIVVSDKMSKTITIEVTTRVRHKKYSKFLTKKTKYHAHDEKEVSSFGDFVAVVESRPMSKNKRWRLKEILKKADNKE